MWSTLQHRVGEAVVEHSVVAEDLAKLYPGGVWGVRRVSFRVRRGSVAVLLGPNGAGKTTTIGILATLLRPTRGRAEVLGMDVVRDASRVRRAIALCPQDVSPDGNWSPLEAVTGFLYTRGLDLSTARREARRWLEELDLWGVRDRPCTQLSGGQRKRVMVAATLATGAEVMFLDEPTAGLDVEGRYKVWRALRRVVRDGATILMTTHMMDEASMVSDHVVLIARGVVVAEGRVDDLVSKLPYRYRVVAKGVRNKQLSGLPTVELGDRVIVYAESRSEAFSIASGIEAESVSVDPVDLEDAYMYLTQGVKKCA